MQPLLEIHNCQLTKANKHKKHDKNPRRKVLTANTCQLSVINVSSHSYLAGNSKIALKSIIIKSMANYKMQFLLMCKLVYVCVRARVCV